MEPMEGVFTEMGYSGPMEDSSCAAMLNKMREGFRQARCSSDTFSATKLARETKSCQNAIEDAQEDVTVWQESLHHRHLCRGPFSEELAVPQVWLQHALALYMYSVPSHSTGEETH